MWRATGGQNKDGQNTRMTEQKWTKQQDERTKMDKTTGERAQMERTTEGIRRMDIKTGG